MELLDNFLVVENGWREVFTQAMKRQLMDRYPLATFVFRNWANIWLACAHRMQLRAECKEDY